MKRILVFCAVVTLCVSFAACGIKNTSFESSGQITASITNDNNTFVPYDESFDNVADSTSDGKTTSNTVTAAIPTPGEQQVLYLCISAVCCVHICQHSELQEICVKH